MKRMGIILSLCVLLGACATLKTSSEFIARGNGYLVDGNVQEAIKHFDKAIALNSNNMDAYQARGMAYYINGNYKESAEDFLTAIKANTNDSNLYTAYAAAAAASKDYANALQALEFAAQINPEKPEIYFSRANIYYLLGKYDLAVQDYSLLLGAYPAAEVFNARAAALIKMGKPDLARADLETARSGKYPEALSEYAQAK